MIELAVPSGSHFSVTRAGLRNSLASVIAGFEGCPGKDYDFIVLRSNSTILVVDDDEDTRTLTAEFISSAGYGCAQADSVVTAQAYLHYNMPALIILDYHMPMVDGIELLKWLRTDPRFKKVPVLLVTGDPAIDLAHVHELGANGFFLKGGMEWEDLVAEIGRYVPVK